MGIPCPGSCLVQPGICQKTVKKGSCSSSCYPGEGRGPSPSRGFVCPVSGLNAAPRGREGLPVGGGTLVALTAH